MCDPLCKLTLSKVTWTWNASYQSLFSRGKLFIKSVMCMIFYNDTKPLYLETDISRVGLGPALLQDTGRYNVPEKTQCQKTPYCVSIAFANKSLMGAKHRYSNIEREALGILHGLKKFHHCCFVREVYVITNHKPLASIFKKDVAIPS